MRSQCANRFFSFCFRFVIRIYKFLEKGRFFFIVLQNVFVSRLCHLQLVIRKNCRYDFSRVSSHCVTFNNASVYATLFISVLSTNLSRNLTNGLTYSRFTHTLHVVFGSWRRCPFFAELVLHTLSAIFQDRLLLKYCSLGHVFHPYTLLESCPTSSYQSLHSNTKFDGVPLYTRSLHFVVDRITGKVPLKNMICSERKPVGDWRLAR